MRTTEHLMMTAILVSSLCRAQIVAATPASSASDSAEKLPRSPNEVVDVLLVPRSCPLYKPDAAEVEAKRLLKESPWRYVPLLLARIHIEEVSGSGGDELQRDELALNIAIIYGTQADRERARKLFSAAHALRMTLDGERQAITNDADPTVAKRRALLHRMGALMGLEDIAIRSFASVRDRSLRDELLAIYDSDIQLRGVIRSYFDETYPGDRAISGRLSQH